jgi:hypothetical protein
MLTGSGIKVFAGAPFEPLGSSGMVELTLRLNSSLLLCMVLLIGNSHPELAEIIARRYLCHAHCLPCIL